LFVDKLGLDDCLKRLVGVFSIYLGFNAAYLLLIDMGIIEPMDTSMITEVKVGPLSVSQKVSFVQNLALKKNMYLNREKEQNMKLFEVLT
jgi:hypothetical protein